MMAMTVTMKMTNFDRDDDEDDEKNPAGLGREDPNG